MTKACPKVHLKLSSKNSFPASYKKLVDASVSNVAGDYLARPREGCTMLKSTSSADLNCPERSSDFVSEVRWRMQLRNGYRHLYGPNDLNEF